MEISTINRVGGLVKSLKCLPKHQVIFYDQRTEVLGGYEMIKPERSIGGYDYLLF